MNPSRRAAKPLSWSLVFPLEQGNLPPPLRRIRPLRGQGPPDALPDPSRPIRRSQASRSARSRSAPRSGIPQHRSRCPPAPTIVNPLSRHLSSCQDVGVVHHTQPAFDRECPDPLARLPWQRQPRRTVSSLPQKLRYRGARPRPSVPACLDTTGRVPETPLSREPCLPCRAARRSRSPFRTMSLHGPARPPRAPRKARPGLRPRPLSTSDCLQDDRPARFSCARLRIYDTGRDLHLESEIKAGLVARDARGDFG